MAGAGKTVIIPSSPLFRLLAFFSYWLTVALCLLVNTFFFRIKVTGRVHLGRLMHKTGCFMVSNHSLYLDPAFIAHAVYPHRIFFAASHLHFRIPFFGTYLRSLGAFPLPAENGLLQIVPVLKQLLVKGYWIHFFPEGELKHFNKVLQPLKDGVFTLAYDFMRPLLPVTIVTKPRYFFGVKAPRPFFKIEVSISPPVEPALFRPAGKPARQARQEAIRSMSRHVADCLAAGLAGSVSGSPAPAGCLRPLLWEPAVRTGCAGEGK